MVRKKTLVRRKSRSTRGAVRVEKNPIEDFMDSAKEIIEDVNELMEHGERIAKSLERFAPPQEHTKLERMMYESVQMRDVDAANILGVQQNATIEQIVIAFKTKIKDCRPDTHPEKQEEYLKYYSAYRIMMSKRKQKVTKGVPRIDVDP